MIMKSGAFDPVQTLDMIEREKVLETTLRQEHSVGSLVAAPVV